jgi:hypothetical protein
MESCNYFYDPTDDNAQFILNFDQDTTHELSDRAAKVIAHLTQLDQEALKEESVQFFKWLVVHNLSLEHKHYSQLLLEFFHSKGLLHLKHSVANPVKQLKARYCVMYTMGGHTFARSYNSIREIKVDTGRKPSQIKRQKMEDVICSSVADPSAAAPPS